MANLIETSNIDGFQVYGLQMVEYTTQGTSATDFASAIAIASLAQSTAIEVETNAYASVLRARQRKLSELGDALAVISQAIASMKTGSGTQSSDQSDAMSALDTASATLSRYGVSMPVSNHKVRRDDAETARNDAQYKMDMESNDMQQDMITLQGLISKRDNSFSTAAKVMKKASSTTTTMIRSIGS